MAVLLLIVVAGGLLAYGWANEDPTYVWIALGASVLAALLVLLSRFGSAAVRRRLTGESVEATSEVEAEDDAVAEDEGVSVSEDGADETADAATVADEDAVAENPGPGDTGGEAADPERVVFVPGRMTFHAPDCSMVKDKQTSSALRTDLEGGGMNACRRCLKH